MEESRNLGARDTQSIDAVPDFSGRQRPISLDTILSAVANVHRRAILKALDDASEETLAFDALVDRVTNRVRDRDLERVSDEQRQRVKIALHHTHLPTLEEARIIDYEPETERVQFVGGDLERDLLTLVEPYELHE